MESRSNGQVISSLKGRKQIGDAFSAYLTTFETVYHINGQQNLDVRGDRATGTSYWLVVLIGMENGRKIKNTSGVIYLEGLDEAGNQ